MSEIHDEHVPEEHEHREMVADALKAISTHAAIADVGDVGAVYSQSEVQAIVDALNESLAVLRDAGLIPSE